MSVKTWKRGGLRECICLLGHTSLSLMHLSFLCPSQISALTFFTSLSFPASPHPSLSLSLSSFSLSTSLRLFFLCSTHLLQVPASYVHLQKLISEEVHRCQKRGAPPVLSQKEFAALADHIPDSDISDPEELSLGMELLLL